MAESTERISDNSDWLLRIIIAIIIAVSVVFIWELLQDPISLRNIFDIGAILATLLTLGYSHYQSRRRYNQAEEGIDELRKTRLQRVHRERERIIDEAIEAAQENIDKLDEHSEGSFTGDLDRILELESIPAQYREYFETNHPDFVESLKKRQKHENELNRLKSPVYVELQDDPDVERYIDKHSKQDTDPTDWLIETIVTFSHVSMDDIENEFGITRESTKIDVQREISATQDNRGSGIFQHRQQPEWIQDYVEAKNNTIEYFRRQQKTLREIKSDQTV